MDGSKKRRFGPSRTRKFGFICKGMQGNNPMISLEFTNSQVEGTIIVRGVSFMVTPKLIVEVIELSLDGIFIPHKSKRNYQEDMKWFLKEDERVNRLQNGFNRAALLGIWSTIAEILMRYVTLKGNFCYFHAHIFPMLNHLRYNIKINFSFCLLSLLKQSTRSV